MGAHHGHDHDLGAGTGKRLTIALALVGGYMVAEVIGGLAASSLALLADAGHMLSDAGALVVALLALRIAGRPASPTHTFGYQRAEILAALLNGAVLLAVAGYIFYGAYQRIGTRVEVEGGLMLGVAAGGLVINLVGLWLLHGGASRSLNVRGAWLHMLTDAVGSVGAMIAGALIVAFGWHWADPVASVLIGMLVIYSAGTLLIQTVEVLMQAVPRHLSIERLERVLLSIDGVLAIHDLHVWSLTSNRDVLSAHLTVADDTDRARVVAETRRLLREEFDLDHSTIQIDCPGECAPCR